MLLKAPSELLVGYLTEQRQREARVLALSPQGGTDKEGGLVSAKADLLSCVWDFAGQAQVC